MHRALDEVDPLVRLECRVPVDDEDEILEEDTEVRDDALRLRRDDGA